MENQVVITILFLRVPSGAKGKVLSLGYISFSPLSQFLSSPNKTGGFSQRRYEMLLRVSCFFHEFRRASVTKEKNRFSSKYLFSFDVDFPLILLDSGGRYGKPYLP